MRVILTILAASAALLAPALPAAGQSYYFGGAGGTPENLNTTYTAIGISGGLGALVTAHTNAHTKGTTYATLSTGIAEDAAGFDLFFGPASTSNVRFLVDVATDTGFTNIIASNIYFEPGSSSTGTVFPVPIDVSLSAGTALYVRMQCSSAGEVTARVAARLRKRTAQSRPLWSVIEALNVDTANTRASGSNIPLVDPASTSFTPLVASTSHAYGAIMALPGHSGTNPTSPQQAQIRLAMGAASSEVVFDTIPTQIIGSSNAWRHTAMVADVSIPANERLSAQVVVQTPGSDTTRLAIYGAR